MARTNYNALTTRELRKMGRHYWKVEHLNPFHIVKERDDLRYFRDMVWNFCRVVSRSDDIEEIKKFTETLLQRDEDTKNNKYFAGERQDCFGFIDYLVIDPIDGITAVQSTGPSGHSDHKKKILRNEYAQRWINFAKIELWSHRKLLVKPGGKAKRWTPRIEEITKEMFVEMAEQMQDAN